MQDLAHEDKVVQAGDLHHHLFFVSALQQSGYPFLHNHRHVTQADGFDAAVAQDRFGHHPRRVGKVQQPGLGTQSLHIGSDLQGDGNGATGVGEAAKAIGLLADQAILEGDTFIADPGVKAAGAKLRADEIGIAQRAFPVKGGHHFNSQPGFGDHSPRQSGDNLDFLFALFNVHQP